MDRTYVASTRPPLDSIASDAPIRDSAILVSDQPKSVRIAIYTRKSSDEGLDQPFNSLDAQRLAVECYVESQRSKCWIALSERYDDGGFSGANTDRPAFQRLLRDVEARKIDCVGVYKIDRLSRSLHDFTRLMAFFARHGVTFVSVTQNFGTTTSVGRMTLNLLATFAEFERETIAERISDKIRASRSRGLWTGGKPPLGYDVVDRRLVVNENEAAQVREMFSLYLRLGSLHYVLAELQRRGWRTKSWSCANGRVREGRLFRRSLLRSHLAQPIYFGKIPYKRQLFDGIHEPLVDRETWDAVQEKLRARCHELGNRNHSSHALLDGIARCGGCGRPYGVGRWTEGSKSRIYYRCRTAHAAGYGACPAATVHADELDGAVVARLRAIARDPALAADEIAVARANAIAHIPEVEGSLKRQVQRWRAAETRYRSCVAEIDRSCRRNRETRHKLTDLQTRRCQAARALVESRAWLLEIRTPPADATALQWTLDAFDRDWDRLCFADRKRRLGQLLLEVRFHPQHHSISLTFRTAGIEFLGDLAQPSAS